MKPRNGDYPVRMFIRHKAMLKLQAAATVGDRGERVDETLFQDITETFFGARNNVDLYRAYGSREQAAAVEDRIVAGIVAAYRQIKTRKGDPLVRKLNSLILRSPSA
ncbi:MAG: hypothetical protein AAF728_11745 [Cyanobacteria bacterium P01_D01_bin.128]